MKIISVTDDCYVVNVYYNEKKKKADENPGNLLVLKRGNIFFRGTNAAKVEDAQRADEHNRKKSVKSK